MSATKLSAVLVGCLALAGSATASAGSATTATSKAASAESRSSAVRCEAVPSYIAPEDAWLTRAMLGLDCIDSLAAHSLSAEQTSGSEGNEMVMVPRHELERIRELTAEVRVATAELLH